MYPAPPVSKILVIFSRPDPVGLLHASSPRGFCQYQLSILAPGIIQSRPVIGPDPTSLNGRRFFPKDTSGRQVGLFRGSCAILRRTASANWNLSTNRQDGKGPMRVSLRTGCLGRRAEKRFRPCANDTRLLLEGPVSRHDGLAPDEAPTLLQS